MALAGLECLSPSDPTASALQVLGVLEPVELCLCGSVPHLQGGSPFCH